MARRRWHHHPGRSGRQWTRPWRRARRAAPRLEIARDGGAALGQERGAPAVEAEHELRVRRPAAHLPGGSPARRDQEREDAALPAPARAASAPGLPAAVLSDHRGERGARRRRWRRGRRRGGGFHVHSLLIPEPERGVVETVRRGGVSCGVAVARNLEEEVPMRGGESQGRRRGDQRAGLPRPGDMLVLRCGVAGDDGPGLEPVMIRDRAGGAGSCRAWGIIPRIYLLSTPARGRLCAVAVSKKRSWRREL